MRSPWRGLVGVAAACVLGGSVAAQVDGADAPRLEVATTEGRTLIVSRLTGDPAGGFEVRSGGATRALRPGDLLAVHGAAVQSVDLAAVWLRGDEVVRGALIGGDAAGDTVTLLSPVLGTVLIPVDRVEAFVPAGNGGLAPADLPLPEGVGEALFTRARIGYDLVAGSLHRFAPGGVRFAPTGDEAPAAYRDRDFVALRIADPEPRSAAPSALLVTRTGDRLGVKVKGFSETGVACELEGGRVADVRLSDLACLTFLDAGTFLSDLEPAEVTESGFDGPVVHPYRRDRAVLGGPLVAAERTHAKGLGVHSRCRLSYRVPDGAEQFWTRVALDDTAAALPFRASVDVRVLRDGEVVFEHRGLESGATPRDSGIVRVHGGETLVLEVDVGLGLDLGDRVAWLTPVFFAAPRR